MNGIREAFERARLDADEIDRALAATEAYLTANAGHPVATAYRGSLHGMKAGAAFLPWVKLRHVEIASALLDEAHARRREAAAAAPHEAAYPADLKILLLRGIAYASFPPFLGRGAAARASLEEAVAHPAFAGIPARYRALAFAHLSLLCGRDSEADAARRFRERAMEADGFTTRQICEA